MPKMTAAEKAALAEHAAETSMRDSGLDEDEIRAALGEPEDPAGVDYAAVQEATAEAERLQLTEGYEFEMVPAEKLQEHPKNANRGDVEAIGRSLSTSGFYGAVVAQRATGYVLAGNHRYRLAKEKGLALIPTIWVDVDPIGAVRIMLADNETARRGRIDLGAQDALIQELREVDPELRGTGFDVALEQLAEEEAAAEAEADHESDDGDDGGEEYGSKYGVIVMCRDEKHQEEVYRTLAELGLGELRVVAV